ncbi:MAG: hypothetical protein Q7U73_04735 [Rubrivivax sp.]|nr:hypothetical protein [Rubrivivax sp.]
MTASCFPFSASVGQDDVKLAILCAAVGARIGSVLLGGDTPPAPWPTGGKGQRWKPLAGKPM